MFPRRPSREELAAAVGRTVPDVIAPGLLVLFCGINPGLYTAAVGHHFARPGNRFWPALHTSGFTNRLVSPWEEGELLRLGLGVTNLVARATASAGELLFEELREGRDLLEDKVRFYRPCFLAMVGVEAFRKAFNQPKAAVGMQEMTISTTAIWVLPNTSGLNAHHTPQDFARLFGELRTAVLRRCKLDNGK
jgi:double-stranded uracil-DNA glycosylase